MDTNTEKNTDTNMGKNMDINMTSMLPDRDIIHLEHIQQEVFQPERIRLWLHNPTCLQDNIPPDSTHHLPGHTPRRVLIQHRLIQLLNPLDLDILQAQVTSAAL